MTYFFRKMNFFSWFSSAQPVVVPFLFLCWIFLVYAAIRRKRKWQYITLLTLAFCYPIGKGLSLMIWGPRFFRFYLADIGWIPFFTFACIVVNELFGRHWMRSTVNVCCTFASIAIMQEIFMLYIQHETRKLGSGARGDMMDLLIFILMYVVTLHLLHSLRRAYVLDSPEYLERVGRSQKDWERLNTPPKKKRHGRSRTS